VQLPNISSNAHSFRLPVAPTSQSRRKRTEAQISCFASARRTKSQTKTGTVIVRSAHSGNPIRKSMPRQGRFRFHGFGLHILQGGEGRKHRSEQVPPAQEASHSRTSMRRPSKPPGLSLCGFPDHSLELPYAREPVCRIAAFELAHGSALVEPSKDTKIRGQGQQSGRQFSAIGGAPRRISAVRWNRKRQRPRNEPNSPPNASQTRSDWDTFESVTIPHLLLAIVPSIRCKPDSAGSTRPRSHCRVYPSSFLSRIENSLRKAHSHA